MGNKQCTLGSKDHALQYGAMSKLARSHFLAAVYFKCVAATSLCTR